MKETYCSRLLAGATLMERSSHRSRDCEEGLREKCYELIMTPIPLVLLRMEQDQRVMDEEVKPDNKGWRKLLFVSPHPYAFYF